MPEIDDGIWRNSRTANRTNDLLATKALLQIVKEPTIQQKLNTKVKGCTKKHVWSEIAIEMNKHGFPMYERAAERCFQKFRNLEYRYKEYIQSFSHPTKVRRSTPEFVDELEELFADKHMLQTSDINDFEGNLNTPKQRPSKMLKLVEPYATINQIREEQRDRDQHYYTAQDKYHKDHEAREHKRFQELKQLLEKQHKERMAATYSLIKALKDNSGEGND